MDAVPYFAKQLQIRAVQQSINTADLVQSILYTATKGWLFCFRSISRENATGDAALLYHVLGSLGLSFLFTARLGRVALYLCRHHGCDMHVEVVAVF